jgi:succinate dehydrogenase (ubiquinone) membrane anchor subunit
MAFRFTNRLAGSMAGSMASRVTPRPAQRRQISQLLAADEGAMATKVYHGSSLALIGLFPVALVLSPSSMNFPIDLALGFAFPLHGHIGFNYIITDYVPKLFGKAARGPARVIMLGITGLTTAGLLRLNLFGPGVTETLKTLWRKPKKD